MNDTFYPLPGVRNPHLQSIIASLKLRVLGANPMTSRAKEIIVDAGEGVRLQGYLSRHETPAKGMIAMIHGWEGSASSAYMLSCGRTLYREGFDIFRLNLRDHGTSHHLNEDLFHGARIDEVFQAMKNISTIAPTMPFYIIGFSLGGNFALRIAVRASDSPLPGLRRIFCISPALDPYKATLAIDRGPAFYRRYFLHKWKRSLRRKQTLFPQRYDFYQYLHLDTLLGLTDALMPYYPDFSGYMDYFNRYTLTDSTFSHLSVPVTVITAEDDPVVPVEDFYSLQSNHFADILIQPYGGHCGFINIFPPGCWYESKITKLLQDEKLGSTPRARHPKPEAS